MPAKNAPVLTEMQRSRPELAWVDKASRMLDTRYRIPGTNIRFGLDFILGLIPFGGDIVSMGISGVLILTMARNGASGRVVAKMIGNVALDAIIGAIPILGDIFDIAYKANYRNLKLMREYYDDGRHRGSAWPIVIGALIALIALMVVVVWIVWELVAWVFGGLF